MKLQEVLTPEHRRQITEAEQMLAQALELIDALEGCGTECREVRAAATETLERLSKLKATFTQPIKRKG